MEVTSINTIQAARKVSQKEAIQSARIEDTITISSDAQKKAEWVEMLKQMPDVRSEKIELSAQWNVSSFDLVCKMIQSGF